MYRTKIACFIPVRSVWAYNVPDKNCVFHSSTQRLGIQYTGQKLRVSFLYAASEHIMYRTKTACFIPLRSVWAYNVPDKNCVFRSYTQRLGIQCTGKKLRVSFLYAASGHIMYRTKTACFIPLRSVWAYNIPDKNCVIHSSTQRLSIQCTGQKLRVSFLYAASGHISI